ncbi:hypothetical protein ACHAXT_011311 [Thalassiosira profunda]
MFSSLSQYSPKSLLASHLSRSLAEFFDVDPNSVEANLVRDAKVVLNDIAIKERDVGDARGDHLRVSGQIRQIEFAWAWDSSAVFMKDVRLTVRGVEVHVRVVGGDEPAVPSSGGGQTTDTPGSDEDAGDEGAPPDWKERYLQQIVDHLTLAITDVTVSIHLDDESQVVLQTKDIELATLPVEGNAGDTTTEGLLQKMSMGSIESWIEQGEACAKHPILEPFGYKASVTRISGRRFLDGILSGLLVEGDPSADASHASSSIRVHAGIRQIEGLNHLQRVLLLVGKDGSGESPPPADSSGINVAETKSIFRLPFRSMEVVLENDTNLSLAGCNVRYCTDGSELLVDCCGGMWVDGTPLFNDGKLMLDIVASELSLVALPEEYEGDLFYSTHSDGDAQSATVKNAPDEPFRLNLTLDMFCKIYRGVMAIVPQCAKAMQTAEQVIERPAPSTPASSRTLKCSEQVAFRFTGENDVWVEVLATAPKLCQSGTASFECAAVYVASNAGFGIHIPRISTDDSGCIRVEYRIAVTVDSVDVFETLQSMWGHVSDIIGDQPSGGAGSPGIPLAVSIAGFDVTLKEPKGSVHLSRIAGSGTEWSIGVLQANNVGNASFDANALQVSLDDHKTTVFVQRIKRLAYDNVDYLASPIEDTTIVVENNEMLSVAFKDVCVKCPAQVATAQSNGRGPETLSLPIEIRITADRLKAKSDAGSVELNGVDFWARPAAEVLMLDLELKGLKASVKDCVDLSCGKINGSAEVGTSLASNDDSTISIPGLGYLSSASMAIHDVVQMSSPVGTLSKPLDAVEVNYGAGTVMIKTDKVLVCPNMNAGGDHTSTDSGFDLPVALYIEVSRFILMPEFGPGLPGLCFDGLQVHLTPTGTSVSVKVQCSGFQGRGKDQSTATGKGVRLSVQKSLCSDGGSLGIKEAHLTMKELSTLSLPSQGISLAKPTCNPAVELRNNSVDVKCDLVHLSHAQAKEQKSAVEQAAPESAEIPLPFSLEVNEVIFASPSDEFHCNQLSAQYLKSSNAPSKSLHVGAASLSQSGTDTTFKVKGISIATKWQGEVAHESVHISPLGMLSFAQAEAEACTELTTNSFSLIKPIHAPKLLFREGFVVLELTELHLDAANAVDNEKQTPQQSEALPFDMVWVPFGFNVSHTLCIKTASFDVLLEKVGIDIVCSATSSRVEAFVHADTLVESKTMSAENIDLNLHLSTEATDSVFPGMEHVHRASVKLGEVASLSVEGKARLTRPLKNVTVSYQDGVVATELAAVQFECPCFEKGLVLGLKGFDLKIQQDPFDQTARSMIQIDTISGHGDVSFGASGVNLIATVVPNANEEVIASKPVPISSFGYASLVFWMLAKSQCSVSRAQRTVVAVPTAPARHREGGTPFELPCKAIISIEAILLHESFEHKAAHREVRCNSLTLTLDPVKVRAGQQHESIRGPGLGFQFIGSNLRSTESSTVVDVPRLSASGLLQLNDLATVGNLAIGIEKAQLAAEFSSPNWSESLEEPPAVIRLPFASIPKFELTLRYVGKLLNLDDATINCDEFHGSVNSTLSQLKSHYVAIAKGRIAFLLTKTDIAGCNLADSAGVMAGKILTHTSVVGATVGVASRDAVGSTLTAGKESRGASAHDKYQFGDFSRGVVSSVKHAAQSGAQMRGDDNYRVGDFTSGTARAAGSYASDNRCRLAGAGGSAMGMVAGAALLGPVGFVAGSLVGGSAAKSSMAALTGDPKKKKPALEEHRHSANDANAMQYQSNSQAPDLLSSEYQQHGPPSSAPPVQPTQQARQGGAVQQQQQHQHQQQYPPQQSNHSSMPATAHQAIDRGHEGYRFGDVTRGIVARGKKADGRDANSGYKFGDFTRGLFK